VIANCISTGREGQWQDDEVDERVMIGKVEGDGVGGDGSSRRSGEGYLYTYVRSFVGKKRGATDQHGMQGDGSKA
jgi:hypothetical protein